jgi:hypothetical protein
MKQGQRGPGVVFQRGAIPTSAAASDIGSLTGKQLEGGDPLQRKGTGLFEQEQVCVGTLVGALQTLSEEGGGRGEEVTPAFAGGRQRSQLLQL